MDNKTTRNTEAAGRHEPMVRHDSPMAMRRIVRANRLVAELGHTDIITALEHALEMKLALQSIARYPHKRDDELGYTGCRNIAKAALNRNA